MTAVFAGLVYISLNIPVHGVDVLPDLAGYLLIAGGAVRLSDKSSKFRTAVLPLIVSGITSLVFLVCFYQTAKRVGNTCKNLI